MLAVNSDPFRVERLVTESAAALNKRFTFVKTEDVQGLRRGINSYGTNSRLRAIIHRISHWIQQVWRKMFVDSGTTVLHKGTAAKDILQAYIYEEIQKATSVDNVSIPNKRDQERFINYREILKQVFPYLQQTEEQEQKEHALDAHEKQVRNTKTLLDLFIDIAAGLEKIEDPSTSWLELTSLMENLGSNAELQRRNSSTCTEEFLKHLPFILEKRKEYYEKSKEVATRKDLNEFNVWGKIFQEKTSQSLSQETLSKAKKDLNEAAKYFAINASAFILPIISPIIAEMKDKRLKTEASLKESRGRIEILKEERKKIADIITEYFNLSSRAEFYPEAIPEFEKFLRANGGTDDEIENHKLFYKRINGILHQKVDEQMQPTTEQWGLERTMIKNETSELENLEKIVRRIEGVSDDFDVSNALISFEQSYLSAVFRNR